MESKKWYQSKSIWSCIIMLVIGTINLISELGYLPAETVVALTKYFTSIAIALGISGRLTAKTTIK